MADVHEILNDLQDQIGDLIKVQGMQRDLTNEMIAGTLMIIKSVLSAVDDHERSATAHLRVALRKHLDSISEADRRATRTAPLNAFLSMLEQPTGSSGLAPVTPLRPKE
jgi:hypothetical protein